MIFMISLYTAIFEKRQYLVAAFAISLACAVLRYRLLKVSSVNYSTAQMQRIMHARSHKHANAFCQTCFTRLADAFGQACKRVPSMAFVHVNGLRTRSPLHANVFACACERIWLGMRTRSKRACVIRCIWAVLYLPSQSYRRDLSLNDIRVAC